MSWKNGALTNDKLDFLLMFLSSSSVRHNLKIGQSLNSCLWPTSASHQTHSEKVGLPTTKYWLFGIISGQIQEWVCLAFSAIFQSGVPPLWKSGSTPLFLSGFDGTLRSFLRPALTAKIQIVQKRKVKRFANCQNHKDFFKIWIPQFTIR